VPIFVILLKRCACADCSSVVETFSPREHFGAETLNKPAAAQQPCVPTMTRTKNGFSTAAWGVRRVPRDRA
jgi:hypothetical protein